jgi:hypothetical protein
MVEGVMHRRLPTLGTSSSPYDFYPYSLNQAEHMQADPAAPFTVAEAFAARFVTHVATKGKVEPGKYRAFGHRPPRHGYADLRLAWREARMRIGKPRAGSSPATQQEAGLNDDVTLRPKKSEGKKRRDG